MEILSFELCGKVAHFRKFYSNASALSYTLPPRTTILGLLAGILELPRDSYYGEDTLHNLDKLLIGIRVNTPVRKVFQKLNYLKIGDSSGKISIPDKLSKGEKENWATRLQQFIRFSGQEHHSQIPTEVIIPDDLRKEDLSYQIFIGTHESENSYFTKLKERIERQYYPFGICLGSANFLGYIKRDKEFLFDGKLLENSNGNEIVKIHSSILSNRVKELQRNIDFEIEQDNYPLRFRMNYSKKANTPTRIAREIEPLIYALRSPEYCLEVRLSDYSNVFHISKTNQNVFLI